MNPRPYHLFLPALAAPALLLAVASCTEADTGVQVTAPDLHRVTRGNLRITVKENAEIKPLQETRVTNNMEGRATIIFLVQEGSQVQEGQRLVELDASDLVVRRSSQAIAVTRAESAYVQAKENNLILEKELKAIHNQAQSKMVIAEMELEKYLGRAAAGTVEAGVDSHKGTNRDMVYKLEKLVAVEDDPLAPEYRSLVAKIREILGAQEADQAKRSIDRDMGELSNKVLEQVDKIRLSRADLKIKEETLHFSIELHANKFITRNELEKHMLERDSQESRVVLAWIELDLLINYTLFKDLLERRQDVENADLEMQQVVASNRARTAKQQADLDSSKLELDLARELLENLEIQIKNAVILAPTPGLVVYAQVGDGRRGGGEVVEEGMDVRERQTLIILPDTRRMTARLKVPEADIDKVAVGQNAVVSVDAYPGQIFPARVTRVAMLPDSGSRWSNNDRKVYKTRVTLIHDNDDNDEQYLRPNMSGTVEIIVGQLQDVLTVPIPAVQRQGLVHYVWKKTRSGAVAIEVEIGMNNLTDVEIKKGVAEGDVVYKAPPLGIVAPQFEQPEAIAPAPAENVEPVLRRGGQAVDASAEQQGMSRSERDQLTADVKAYLLEKFPERADELEGRGYFRLLREPEIQAAMAANPELQARYEAMIRSFMSGRGGRGFGNRGEGGSPGRNRGAGSRPGGRGTRGGGGE